MDDATDLRRLAESLTATGRDLEAVASAARPVVRLDQVCGYDGAYSWPYDSLKLTQQILGGTQLVDSAQQLVHCFTYIRSAVEAPRAQWQGATRERS